MPWVQLPSWALAAPTDRDVAVRARLDAPAACAWHTRHARLDLSRLGLERLPTGAEPALARSGGRARLAAIRELDASGNELGRAGAPPLELGDERSSLGPALTALNLSGNGLTATGLHGASFPPRLRLLDLSTNVIAALPPNVLGLGALVRLELSRNRLTKLPARLGASLPCLELLDLSHNDFAAFTPRELGRAPAAADAGARGRAGAGGRGCAGAGGGSGGGPESSESPACAFRSLRVLRLRANRLEAFELGAPSLPRLATLDLAANRLSRPSASLCTLGTLTHLNLSSNRLASLLSDEAAPARRVWAPAGLHQLSALTFLSVAQNVLTNVPAPLASSLFEHLAELDIRCNPLSADSQALLSRLAASPPQPQPAAAEPADASAPPHPAPAVRVRSSLALRLLPGLLLGDASVTWDIRTLRSIGVTHIVRIGEPAEMGRSRHARPVRADEPALAEPLRVLGLLGDGGSPGDGESPGGGQGSAALASGGRRTGALLDPRSVRDAFLRLARLHHPDRLLQRNPAASAAELGAAEALFAAARGAYETVCEAARAEAVQMPTFAEVRYHHLSLGSGGARGSVAAAGAGGTADAVDTESREEADRQERVRAEEGEGDELARRAAVEGACRALDEANRFIHEARSAPAGSHVVLVHAATGWERAAAVVSAYMVAATGDPLERCVEACLAGMLQPAPRGAPAAHGRAGEGALDALPAHLAEALRAFEKGCLEQRRRVRDVVTEAGADVSREAQAATSSGFGLQPSRAGTAATASNGAARDATAQAEAAMTAARPKQRLQLQPVDEVAAVNAIAAEAGGTEGGDQLDWGMISFSLN